MSDTTSISYADHTWSPWLGCEPVSRGCAHCYASAISKRAGRGAYRHGMERVLTKDWKKPKRWEKLCKLGRELFELRSERVLVSMCDPFDMEAPAEWHLRFWELVKQTPNLTWLILTKRPEVALSHRTIPPNNVWLGVSVEDQERANERIPILLQIHAKVRWVSYEPALGPVEGWFGVQGGWLKGEKLDWVVVGGESGFNHRCMDVDWVRYTVDQCRLAGIACYVKQDSARFPGQQGKIPTELWRVREFPNV